VRAIALFSGANKDKAKEIWLVDPAPEVIKQLDGAVSKLEKFMDSQGLSCSQGTVVRGKYACL
jgi:type I restriction enzyme R subunit